MNKYMKRFLPIFLLFACVNTMVFGQTIIVKNDSDLKGYAAIPKENIFVHFNTPLLFPAEYLYYTVYCMNEKSNGYSDISKVAYVELVGEDLVPIFKQKIQLIDGVGQGDFFVPTTVPSGNYKLIAYTQWMKNGGEANIFRSNMAIINPYHENQTEILLPVIKRDSLIDSLEIVKERIEIKPRETFVNSGPWDMFLNGKNFGKRERVVLTLNNKHADDSINGRYSVSVRKIDALPKIPKLRTPDYLKTYNPSKWHSRPSISSNVYLPELRGELISGRVLNSKNGEPAPNLDVALSLPGKEYRFRIAQTNKDGVFYMNMNPDYTADTSIIQIIGDSTSEYAIHLDEKAHIDYSKLIFGEFRIDDTMANEILERSVHNQIESAYFSFRPDSLLSLRPEMPFMENMTIYQLEDYTPFKTVREAVLEIIKNVWVRHNILGNEEIEVKSIELESNPDLLPLIIIDGVIVQDHEALLNFDARRISTISVYQGRYIFAPHIYQGVIVFETKNGDFLQDQNIPQAKVFNTFKPQQVKRYFVQDYEQSAVSPQGNLPDDRQQLVWMPNARFYGNTDQLQFYTSDVQGEFEISVEGFTDQGEPVSLRETFKID